MVRNISRFLSILVVLFFGLFIIEGFSPTFTLADSVSHLALTLIVLAIAVGSWKWPKVGGWFFVGLGILFGFFFTPFLWAGLIIGGIVFVTGALFVLEGFKILK
ncbi:hypothetical protein GYA44_02595 [Candidatus Microgenomates bacterium]|nr:hypothetical protein [Candidatus Microgenomates bacterium]